MRRAVMWIGALYVAAWGWRGMTTSLRYFSAHEFGSSWPLMNRQLLEALDEFRHELGQPVHISPHPGSLARYLSPSAKTMHNVTRYRQVMAADVLIPAETSLQHAYDVARRIERFSGIGVYPDWRPRHGLHLDVRHLADDAPEADPADPAKWSGRRIGGDQRYVSVTWGFRDDLPEGIA